jgi:hypothetical protein
MIPIVAAGAFVTVVVLLVVWLRREPRPYQPHDHFDTLSTYVILDSIADMFDEW